jgi:hypothetical protein
MREFTKAAVGLELSHWSAPSSALWQRDFRHGKISMTRQNAETATWIDRIMVHGAFQKLVLVDSYRPAKARREISSQQSL